MQAPVELHPALRLGWECVDRVRAQLLETIRPLTVAQWAFRPRAGAWCIAEQAEHLLRAEVGSSKMVRRLIRGDYRTHAIPPDATLYTAALDRYPYGRLDAPPNLVPGPIRDPADLERELDAAHARFRSELSLFRGDDPEGLRSPDPATGVWFSLGGWVKLQAWHEAHHISQIQTIVAAPGFPRS